MQLFDQSEFFIGFFFVRRIMQLFIERCFRNAVFDQQMAIGFIIAKITPFIMQGILEVAGKGYGEVMMIIFEYA